MFAFMAIGAGAQAIPTGVPISFDNILSLSENIGGFLMILGGIIAGIAVVWSGLSYMLAGSDSSRVKSSKDTLKAALIGAFILFSSGVIINVIRLFATNPLDFFK